MEPSAPVMMPVSPICPPPSAWKGVLRRIAVISVPSAAEASSLPSLPTRRSFVVPSSSMVDKEEISSFVVSGVATLAETLARAALALSFCSAIAASKPALSTESPFSAAISCVSSHGNP